MFFTLISERSNLFILHRCAQSFALVHECNWNPLLRFIMYLGVLLEPLPVYHTPVWGPQRTTQHFGSSGTGVTDSCGAPWGSWDLNLSPLRQQSVLLSSGPYLQPPKTTVLEIEIRFYRYYWLSWFLRKYRKGVLKSSDIIGFLPQTHCSIFSCAGWGHMTEWKHHRDIYWRFAFLLAWPFLYYVLRNCNWTALFSFA